MAIRMKEMKLKRQAISVWIPCMRLGDLALRAEEVLKPHNEE